MGKGTLAGHDAPTAAREWDLQPYGAFTLFFRWRKKSVQKKASGTATPEAARPAVRRGLRSAGALRAVLDLGSLRSPAGKKPFTAHFDGGARNVARNGVGQLSHTGGARSCSPFPPSKWAGLFPSAAYRRSAPPQLAVGRLIPCGVNGFLMVGWLCRDKGQQVFEKMLAFVASHEARRRMAV